MTIEIICPWCQQAIVGASAIAGTKVSCPHCHEKFKVRIPSHPDHHPFKKRRRKRSRHAADAPQRQRGGELRRSQPAPSIVTVPPDLRGPVVSPPAYLARELKEQEARKNKGAPLSGLGFTFSLALGTLLSIAVCWALGFTLLRMLRPNSTSTDTSATKGNTSDDLRDQWRIPKFPDLIKQGEVKNRNVSIFEVDLGLASGFPHDMAGGKMRLRVLMPTSPNNAEPSRHSLGCVLIPAGGKNPFHGYDVLPIKNLEPLFPFAAQGLVAIHFSVDGAMPKAEYSNQTHFWDDLQIATRALLKADGGLENCRLALEFALQKIPAVNPGQIYIAGEHSGGTLALKFAAIEPRIAASVAMTPMIDLERAIEQLAVPAARTELRDQMRQIAGKYPLLSLVEQIKCPVMLTHMRGDKTYPFRESEDFAARLRLSNPAVDYLPAEFNPEDPYYANMKYMNSAAWIRGIVKPIELPDVTHEEPPKSGPLK